MVSGDRVALLSMATAGGAQGVSDAEHPFLLSFPTARHYPRFFAPVKHFLSRFADYFD